MTRNKSYLQKIARINARSEEIFNKVLNSPEDKQARYDLVEFAAFMFNKLSEDYNTTMADIIAHYCGLDDDSIIK